MDLRHKVKHQQDLLNEFTGTVSEINDLLAKLQQHTDDHFGIAPEAVNWGHVGRLNYIKSQMQIILDAAS